jgi:hypothetical protein
MDQLLPILVAEPELGGRAVLEIEVDPSHPVVDPSADTSGCEIVSVCCLTSLFLGLG